MASESMVATPGNAMDSYLRFPGGVPANVQTGQPAGRFIRKAQNAKFFTYLHEYTPAVTVGWVAGAVNIANSINVDGDAEFHIIKQAVLGFDELGVQQLDDTIKFEVSPVSEGFNFTETYLSQYGSGRFPNLFGTPLVLPRTSIYTALASNRSVSGLLSTIRFAHFGAKVYRNPYIGQRVYRQQKPFTYAASYGGGVQGANAALPAGGTDIYTLRTDGDSDFDVKKITVVSDAPVTLQVRTDEDAWFARPIRSELLGGSLIRNYGTLGYVSGEVPFMMPVPRLISGAGYINVQAANTDVVNPTRLQVVFWGTRLYPAGGLNS